MTGLWYSLSLYGEDLNVYLQGVDFQIDATICEGDRRGAAMFKDFFGGGTLGNVRSSKKQIVPVKSLLPQSMPSHSGCYLTLDALRAQSDGSLITVLSTPFHYPR